ncbi:hypothetical protein BDA99DRAFT_532027 [Phascolomyces articulosus]|uniref:RNA polymerase II-associated protein 3 n=1 Tax=Phascolomyces articulosus TaxID=60185 RepID=A0AAD5KAY0_9FUNG|nr:hypothetical protein BDA99DRAFT_532027 [Phascolomyces articulosus]
MVENKELLDDLLIWADSIRKKDEQLQKKKPFRNEILPPMRKSTQLVIDEFSKPIGSNYLKKKKVKSEPVETTSVTASSLLKEDNKDFHEKAQVEKEKGNKAFQKQLYQEAISHYDCAIQYGQQSPAETLTVYYTNRAMAYLKISKFLEAEQDCTNALKLHPKNLKAVWRRGVARRELGRIEDSRLDFKMALTIEPGNKVVLEELKKLPLKESKIAGSSLSPKLSTTTRTKPLEESKVMPNQEKERKSVERKRLPIKVIDEAYSAMRGDVDTPTALDRSANSTNATVSESCNKKNIKIQEINSDDKSIPTTVKTKTPRLPPMKFSVPKTNFEFERDWRACRHRGADVLYQYFQAIPPSFYPTLFRSSLDSDQFEQMIDLLESHYTKYHTEKEIYRVLEGLSQVRRIDMLVMFLGNNHKKVLQGLFARMKDKMDQRDLSKLSNAFGVE